MFISVGEAGDSGEGDGVRGRMFLLNNEHKISYRDNTIDAQREGETKR